MGGENTTGSGAAGVASGAMGEVTGVVDSVSVSCRSPNESLRGSGTECRDSVGNVDDGGDIGSGGVRGELCSFPSLKSGVEVGLGTCLRGVLTNPPVPAVTAEVGVTSCVDLKWDPYLRMNLLFRRVSRPLPETLTTLVIWSCFNHRTALVPFVRETTTLILYHDSIAMAKWWERTRVFT